MKGKKALHEKELYEYTLHASGDTAEVAEQNLNDQKNELEGKLGTLPDPFHTKYFIECTLDDGIRGAFTAGSQESFGQAIELAQQRIHSPFIIDAYKIDQLYKLPKVPRASAPTAAYNTRNGNERQTLDSGLHMPGIENYL